jgi:putative heme-binding domain-containing protein
VLYYRMAKLGRGRMPHIGSDVVDEEGLKLIAQWIERLVKTPSAVKTDEEVDKALSSTAGALDLVRGLDQKAFPEKLEKKIIQRGAQHAQPLVRDLFERFVPAAERRKRLGPGAQAAEILALAGDAGRGRKLFFEGGVQCKTCHRVGERPDGPGPELSKIGARHGRAQILESILEPSKLIDPAYVTYVARTKEGLIYSGILIEKSEREVVLKDPENKQIRLAASDVEKMVPQSKSSMPDFLLQDLTAQEAADLLEFLSALK